MLLKALERPLIACRFPAWTAEESELEGIRPFKCAVGQGHHAQKKADEKSVPGRHFCWGDERLVPCLFRQRSGNH